MLTKFKKITALVATILSLNAFGQSDKKEMDKDKFGKLETSLNTNKKKYQLGESIELYFEVINNTSKQYSFCFWQTPLEGQFTGDFLNIFNINNGEKINYSGKMVKRRPPEISDYIELKPGKSEKGKIIINREYKILRKGMYEISFPHRGVLKGSNKIQITVE